MDSIPVVLFAYARPDHLKRTLACLRDNSVPFIYAYCDAARTEENAPAVEEVRRLIREVDWCEVSIKERQTNLGLGRSIVSGVTEVLTRHESAIIFEDDLVCVPGTYHYLSAALKAYAHDQRVMSVTGWTHPLITPPGTGQLPYFDGRAECWVWGTWSRAWKGMDQTAASLMEQCKSRGIDVYRYGSDLVEMAERELELNIWAVRFLYLHILRGALCMRPPWSMVEHIGFDSSATNAVSEIWLKHEALRPMPPMPISWPEPVESPACAKLHRSVGGARSTTPGLIRRVFRKISASLTN